MEFITLLVDFILHVDQHLQELINDYGVWVYLILFLIIFCETGLVVTPFLPGDSLLFAAGALTVGTALNVHALVLLLIVAAVLGNTINYSVGRFMGDTLFKDPSSRVFRRDYLERTQAFYERFGGATIIVTRFLPIVRTFAPFVAGMGKMPYARFTFYNVVGALAWVCSFVYVGHFFGNLPFIKANFTVLMLAIIGVSVLPMVIAGVRQWLKSREVVR